MKMQLGRWYELDWGNPAYFMIIYLNKRDDEFGFLLADTEPEGADIPPNKFEVNFDIWSDWDFSDSVPNLLKQLPSSVRFKLKRTDERKTLKIVFGEYN